MKRLTVGVLGLVVASTGIVGCAGLVAGSALAVLKLSTSSLPGGALQHSYSASVSVTGGRPPYAWGVIAGQLPPGLALSTVGGGISGTPVQTGTFTFSIQVKDSTGHSDSSAYSVNIASVPTPNPAPIISGTSPNSGPTSGGIAVTISGTNFQTGASVLFGGVGAASVTVVSATQIQVMTSAHVAGPVDVTVQNLDGQSATRSGGFTYTAPPPVNPPSITGISPNSGPTSGGTAVTVTGTNFQTGATVFFGGLGAAPVTIVSATQIQAVTQAHVAGPVDVVVQNLDGQSATRSGGFVYTAVSPTVSSVSPSTGSTAGGTSVSITGANFLAGALVLFGTASAPTVTVNSAAQIQAVTPANAAGLVDVTVQNSNGQSGIMVGAFTYTAPVITSLTINPANPSVPVNGTVTFAAADNNGANQTAAATWASSDPTTVSMNSNVGTCLKASTAPVTVTAKVGTASGTASATCTSPSTSSLLGGCTVNTSNQPNCTLPAGWTFVVAQGFDSGTVPPSQAITAYSQTSISTFNPHTGTQSLSGVYGGDGDNIAWFLASGVTGSFADIYVSYWDYVDSSALYPNSDYWMVQFKQINAPAGCGAYQDYSIDAQNFTQGIASSTTTQFIGISAGDTADTNIACQGHYQYQSAPTLSINAGRWRQYEIWYHPSTVTSGTQTSNQGDGEARMWVDGVLQLHDGPGVNLNGTVNMANSQIMVGGVITSFSSATGAQYHTVRCGPFSACPGTQPGTGAPPPFHRYIDDIIVMKK